MGCTFVSVTNTNIIDIASQTDSVKIDFIVLPNHKKTWGAAVSNTSKWTNWKSVNGEVHWIDTLKMNTRLEETVLKLRKQKHCFISKGKWSLGNCTDDICLEIHFVLLSHSFYAPALAIIKKKTHIPSRFFRSYRLLLTHVFSFYL